MGPGPGTTRGDLGSGAHAGKASLAAWGHKEAQLLCQAAQTKQ